MFQVIEFMAVMTAAIYGIFQARAAKMDMLGVFTLAAAVAFGGGTLRDLFLDRHPLFWIANSQYTIIVFVMVLVSCSFKKLPIAAKKYLLIPDAVGMGLFSVVGTQFAIEQGTDAFTASLMGVITGTFGGVISDVLCNRVPALFKAAPLYATCSFVGCWVFLALSYLGVADPTSAPIAILVIVGSRFAAVHWNITLPELDE